MSTHDYNIANASGASVRADINSALDAVASNNASATAPSTTFPHQWWMDESTNLLKQRNAGNTAWVTIGIKDADGFRVYHNGADLSATYVRAHSVTDGLSIPSLTATKITFTTEESDAGGHYASGTYTVPITGIYDIRAGAGVPSVGPGTDFQTLIAVYVNGALKAQGGQVNTDGSRLVTVANLLPLTAADTVEIYVTQGHGSSIAINSPANGSDRWYFEAMRVR